VPAAKVCARQSQRAARPRGGQREAVPAHTPASSPLRKLEHRSRLLSIRPGQLTHGGECLRSYLTIRSSGLACGKPLTSNVRAPNTPHIEVLLLELATRGAGNWAPLTGHLQARIVQPRYTTANQELSKCESQRRLWFQ
jgi:hypothetical protein